MCYNKNTQDEPHSRDSNVGLLIFLPLLFRLKYLDMYRMKCHELIGLQISMASGMSSKFADFDFSCAPPRGSHLWLRLEGLHIFWVDLILASNFIETSRMNPLRMNCNTLGDSLTFRLFRIKYLKNKLNFHQSQLNFVFSAN